jgi:hypothetical protein
MGPVVDTGKKRRKKKPKKTESETTTIHYEAENVRQGFLFEIGPGQ